MAKGGRASGPLAGATLAAIIVTLVALSHSLTPAIVLAIFFVIYQRVENHLLPRSANASAARVRRCLCPTTARP